MKDSLKIVAVRIKNKSGIVSITVLGTKARRAIALTAGTQARAMERVYLFPALSCERNGEMRRLLVRLIQTQRCLPVRVT
jgi:hypothetical protein